MTTTITGATGIDNIKAATGAVLQVLIVEDSSQMSVATATYTDTNLSLTITPSSASSKILAMWNVQGQLAATSSGWGTQLVRDSTNVFTNTTQYAQYANSYTNRRDNADYKHLDSPNTTSAITYKVQVGTFNGATVHFNADNNQTQLVLMEIAG